MSQISEFESSLKELVQAKRLSASKITKLTEMAMGSLEHDTQMVSTLYRTHKSLAKEHKISSLYVFDALARAAKSKANKLGLTVPEDTTGLSGNAATFLSKLGGVVEGLYQDMLSCEVPEAKAKCKKVLDLWVKGNTFPASLLSRLSVILEGKKKEPETNGHAPLNVSIPASEPVSTLPFAPAPPISATPSAGTPVAEPNPQAALLALLAQAASTTSLQTNVNTPAVAPLDPAQLAILQQLTQTAAAANVVSPAAAIPNVSLHTITPATQGNTFVPGPNRSSRSPIPDDPRRPNRDESRRERQFSPEDGRFHHDNRSDNRSYSRDPRANQRGHPPRGGRGGWSERRRWDDRDYNRERDRDRDYRGRSRSRSPPSRYSDKRGDRFLSPRRDGPLSGSSWSNSGRAEPPRNLPGKDEFGRDIRSPSPAPDTKASSNQHHPDQPPPTAAAVTPLSKPSQPDKDSSSTTSASNTHDGENMPMPAPVAPITSSDASSLDPNTTNSSQPQQPQQQQEVDFDFTNFDLTSPASWEALGKMWQVTYGYAPTQEQLMQFGMTMMFQAQMAAGGGGGAAVPVNGQQQQEWEAGGQGMAKQQQQDWGATTVDPRLSKGFGNRGRGRGGPSHGIGRDGQRGQRSGYNSNYSSNDTDAIVLGGGDSSDSYIQHNQQSTNTPIGTYAGSASPPTASSGGKMEKVGDKWVFVRNNTPVL
ncbi:hypothetical protein CC2G_011892 [Coprinopsis cinerea AmutBmut pab1-1]|nr:hypothetical protein CC2G_011892 [Coprinopsis cinerea AmutBmut pab1-1]